MTYLDQDTINELSGLLGDDFHSILDEFITQLSEQRQALDSAISSRDWTAVARISHTIKGSAGNLGAGALSKVAAELETVASDGNDLDAAKLAADLERVADASIAAYAALGFSLQS